jgi:hypothetical protein
MGLRPRFGPGPRALADNTPLTAVHGEQNSQQSTSVEDLKTLEALEDRLDLEEARQIMKKPGRLIPWEKVKREVYR